MATLYKNQSVQVIHITPIVQTFGRNTVVSDMAYIYFDGESIDDAYYVPADEIVSV